MDGTADRTTTAAMIVHTSAAQHQIRPEILDVFREASFRDEAGRERQNYQKAFDHLIGLFGGSAEMAVVSWLIAHDVAALIGDRDPNGWRWRAVTVTYGDASLETAEREFEEFESLFFALACKFFPVAMQMRDCLPFYDEGLDDLVKALRPFSRPRSRAVDSRSEWHATAKLFAERVEDRFRAVRLAPPKRNSVSSSLVLAVQKLLGMVGLHVEADTIRKALCSSSTSRAPAVLPPIGA